MSRNITRLPGSDTVTIPENRVCGRDYGIASPRASGTRTGSGSVHKDSMGPAGFEPATSAV